ncbi:MAG TPA: chorismate synthase [Chitinophagaceae bacterium]|nr:chorismate synthase [Chitinophagaceae bacterium]
MNSFGRVFRIHILGESHGQSVGFCLDGCPAGIPLQTGDFLADLERRKPGAKGTTPRKEDDLPLIRSGVFQDTTTGAPILILFENNNTRSADYEKIRSVPRPGHADFVAKKKFGGFEDYRGGGHFSGRLTVCLVAAGVIAKKILQTPPFHQSAEVSGPVTVRADLTEVGGETDIDLGIQKAIEAKDSVGGIVECRVDGILPGLGEPFFDSVESLLAHAAFAIPAVKGIEFGAGFRAARMFGSAHNDPLIDNSGRTATNHAGGIVGGITNGNQLVFRVVVKPTSSTPKEQHTLNLNSGNVEPFSVKGRHDLCIALRVPVVLEAVTAMTLVDLLMLEQQRPRVYRT